MVLVRRHRATPIVTRNDESSSLSVAPGKAISPVSNISARFFNSPSGLISGRAVKIVLLAIVVCWITAIYSILKSKSALEQVQYAYSVKQMERESVLETLNDAEEARRVVQTQVNEEKHTNQVLKHEVKIMNEMEDNSMSKSEKRREKRKGIAQHDALVEWLEERHQVLEEKAEKLKKHVQEESKRAVLEKYGAGPHRVKISVQIGDKASIRTFELEMAPLDEMPHAIQMFLDTVSKGLWNSCLFWHGHDKVEHVLVASPLSPFSGDSRMNYFEKAGVDKLSFPEYSEAFPHTVGTVSFNQLGPSFFINLQDNVLSHGPGGQKHHALPGDAEPCFAKVVEGMNVVNQMHSFKGRIKTNGWSAEPMSRIIKAEIV